MCPRALRQGPLPADHRWRREEAARGCGPGDFDGVRLVLTPDTRSPRAALGPIAWAVLEDVLLDARQDEQGRLMATTNVRRVSAHVGIAKDTAAKALARLAAGGLLTRRRQRHGAAGKFIPSTYEVCDLAAAGITMVAPAPNPGLAQVRSGGEKPGRRREGSRASRPEQRVMFDLAGEALEHQ